MAIHPNLHERISTKIIDQVPEFVQLDHATFTSFLEAYFEYLEQTGQAYEAVSQSHFYMDIDKTTSSFIKWFKRKFLVDLPNDTQSSKEFLVKHIRDFYRARGTQKAYRFLFRSLFNEEIEFRYPKEDILKASDGNWIQEDFLKTTASDDVLALLDRKITGATSGASAIVEQILQIQEGTNTVHELTLSHKKGNFSPGETVNGTDANLVAKSFVADCGIESTSITNPGSGYSVNDIVGISGGGAGAVNMSVKVKSILGGTITGTAITTPGTGYSVNDYFTLNNTNKLAVDGVSAAIRVTEVEGIVDGLTLTAPGDGYTTPPSVTFSGGGGTGATADTILDPFGVVSIAVGSGGSGYTSATVEIEGGGGNGATATATVAAGAVTSFTITNRGVGYTTSPRIIIRGDGTSATGTATVGAKVNSIRLLEKGQGYTSSPTVTISGSPGSGASATSSVVGSNGDGRITAVEIENPGKNYIALPTISAASIGNGDAVITLSSTTIGGINELLIVQPGFGLTSSPTLDLTGIGDGLATANAVHGSSLTKGIGRWVNTNGHLSSNKVLQDNLFFQDYSYVIGHAGQTVSLWRDSILRTLHPAGMKLFGEIIIRDTLQLPTTAVSLSGADYTLIFPLLDDSQVPIGTATVSGGIQDITIKLNLYNENDGIQSQLANTHNTMSKMLFFTQGGYSTEIDGSSPVLNATLGAGGSGYSSPTASFSGGGGSGATATVTESGGVIDSITLTSAGTGYTSPPTITISGGGGSGATAYSTIGADNGTYSLKYLDGYFGGQMIEKFEDQPQKRIKLAPESFIELEGIV